MQGSVSKILEGCEVLLSRASQINYSIDVKEASDDLIKSRDRLIELRSATDDYDEDAVEAQKKIVLEDCHVLRSALKVYDSTYWAECELYDRVSKVYSELYARVFEGHVGTPKLVALMEFKLITMYLEKLQYIGATLTDKELSTLEQIEGDILNNFGMEVANG